MDYPIKVDILGTEYTIVKHSAQEDGELEGLGGYCRYMIPEIVIGDLTTYDEFKDSQPVAIESMEKQTLRHEIIHAFLNESGLGVNTFASEQIPWSQNEEMVDWFAIQFPKLIMTFMTVGCL